MIFIKLGQFSFATIYPTQYFSSIINKNMSSFVAVKNRRIADIQSDTMLPNIEPYSELHSLFCMFIDVRKLFTICIKVG
jgi:hypothetical protein